MRRGDENGAMRVSSLSHEEPLVGMEPGVDIVWEIIGKNCRNGSDSVIGKGETSLRRGCYAQALGVVDVGSLSVELSWKVRVRSSRASQGQNHGVRRGYGDSREVRQSA